MMSESDLLKSRKKMRHCIVMRKLGLSTCFELYEESTHEFLMSCVTSVSISPMLLFVKLKDCHLRRFEDICCNLNLRHFVARMLPDWLTGLTYKLTGFEGKTICEIKIKPQLLSSTPIHFTAKLANEEYEEDEEEIYNNAKPHNTTQNFNFFSCLEANCFDEPKIESDPLTSSNATSSIRKQDNSTYTTLEDAAKLNKIICLQTKKPLWNEETKTWTHGFGGRVKMPSEKNFIAVQTVVNDKSDKFYKTALEDQAQDKLCIRHGKINDSTFVLDFRSPASPIVAFAIACAIYCH